MDFILYSPLTTFFFRFFPMPLIAFSLCGRKRFCLLLYLMRFSLLSGAGFLVHIISTSPKRDRSKLFEMGSRGLCFLWGGVRAKIYVLVGGIYSGYTATPKAFASKVWEKCARNVSPRPPLCVNIKEKAFPIIHPSCLPPEPPLPAALLRSCRCLSRNMFRQMIFTYIYTTIAVVWKYSSRILFKRSSPRVLWVEEVFFSPPLSSTPPPRV